jgi:hypothetical protein
MRPFTVIVFNPVCEPLLGLLERVELGPGQELLFERLPQTFDLPQRLRMLGTGEDVVNVVFGQFLLELGLPAPIGVLPPVVGQQFLRNPVGSDGPPIGLDDVFRALAPIEPQSCYEPRIVIDEPDDIDGLVLQSEHRDVALPELIGLAVFEAPVGQRLRLVLALFGRRFQALGLDVRPHRGRTRPHAEQPPQHLRDPPGAPQRVLDLQFRDLFDHGSGQAALARACLLILQTSRAARLVKTNPSAYRTVGGAYFLRHQT